MASSMVVLALIFSLISLILSSPVPKQQCSLEVTVSGRQVSILDVLKSHQCTPNATLYTGLRGVASKEELTVCTGLAALVSYGVEKNLKRFCSTASTKESLEEYCHVYADGSQAQVLQDLIDQSVSSKLPSFYITALSTLSGLNRESCNAACGEIRNEMCIMLLQLGKVFLSSIKGANNSKFKPVLKDEDQVNPKIPTQEHNKTQFTKQVHQRSRGQSVIRQIRQVMDTFDRNNEQKPLVSVSRQNDNNEVFAKGQPQSTDAPQKVGQSHPFLTKDHRMTGSKEFDVLGESPEDTKTQNNLPIPNNKPYDTKKPEQLTDPQDKPLQPAENVLQNTLQPLDNIEYDNKPQNTPPIQPIGNKLPNVDLPRPLIGRPFKPVDYKLQGASQPTSNEALGSLNSHSPHEVPFQEQQTLHQPTDKTLEAVDSNPLTETVAPLDDKPISEKPSEVDSKQQETPQSFNSRPSEAVSHVDDKLSGSIDILKRPSDSKPSDNKAHLVDDTESQDTNMDSFLADDEVNGRVNKKLPNDKSGDQTKSNKLPYSEGQQQQQAAKHVSPTSALDDEEYEEYQGYGTLHFITIFMFVVVIVLVGYCFIQYRKKLQGGTITYRRHRPLSQQ